MSGSHDVSPRVLRRSRAAWGALFGVLTAEAFGGLAVLVPVAQGFFAAQDEPVGARLSLLLALVISWGWVLATLVGGARTRASWARGSALTIHVLMFAAGTGVLQGILGTPLLGWVLVLLALAGFLSALLARPMYAEAAAPSDGENP